MQGQVYWWPWPVLSCGQPLALIQATKPIQTQDQELKPFTVGGSLHPGWPDCPNTSPPALSMVPRYKPHIELGPMALMGFSPMTCGEQGIWMAALYRGTEGSPLGRQGGIIQSHAGVPLGVHSTGPHLCAVWMGPDSSSWCPWRELGPVDRWIWKEKAVAS